MFNPLRYINQFKQISGNAKTRVIFVVIFLVFIWLFLPLIPVNDSYPFAPVGVRWAITAISVFAVFIWYMISFFLRHKGKAFGILKLAAIKAWDFIKATFIVIGQYATEYYHDIHDRLKKDQKHKRLKRLPWYLVLGTPQSGKRSIVQNTGLHFQRPEYLGDEAIHYTKTFPEFSWSFSPEAVLVDVMSGNVNADLSAWKRFVKLLKRERKSRPLNGVVLTFSMTDLILYSNKERQDFLQQLSFYIREIYTVFKSFVPVYIVFNKCDLIEGFMEFFENLSKEELSQVWGMSLPIDGSNDLDNVLGFFNREYTGLLEQLRKRVMWAFDTERTLRGRELINAFPQQMQLFRKPIEHFLVELFGTTRFHKAVQLRGIYFTSCVQGQGESHDFLVQAMSKKFQLVPPTFKRHARVGQPYFLNSLFFEVILPEALFLGDSERRKKIHRVMYRTLLLGCPLVAMTLWIGMHDGYVANKQNMDSVQQYIDGYNTSLANLQSTDQQVADTLPVLDNLEQAKNLYSYQTSWGLPLLFATYHVKNAISVAEQRALSYLFWPRVASTLESALNQNVQDQNLLYAYLKGYLVFSDTQNTSSDALEAPMTYLWSQSYSNDPATEEKLEFYLSQGIQSVVTKFPLDQNLIAQTRAQLRKVLPSDRAYGLLSLRANVSSNGSIYFPTLLGTNFDTVFLLNDTSMNISSLYTDAAFNNIYLAEYKDIANEIATDNREIGLSNEIREDDSVSGLEKSMQNTYNQRYTATWNKNLANIQVRPFTSLDQAVTVLNVLISKDSPLTGLLKTVYSNTNDVSAHGIDVDDQFSDMNKYTKNTSWGASSQGTMKVLTQLRDYLQQLEQDPNPSMASFNAAVAIVQGKQNNPMQALNELAANSPEPVRQWLQSVANNCWQAILSGAYQQINTAWQAQIMSSYGVTMRGRYPFNSTSSANVDINTFNAVFSNGGALDLFFTQYIKPFVNTDKSTWVLYQRNGLDLGLSKQNLALFQTAMTVRNEFFPNGAKTAQFNITVQPLTLDKRASSVQFNVGSQNISYSHGPQTTATINWPLTGTSQNSAVVVNTFDDGQYSREVTGPWSLFKVFQFGDLKASSDNGVYLFKINFRGYTASYQVTGPNQISMFTLNDLKGYSLPDNIVSLPSAQAGS